MKLTLIILVSLFLAYGCSKSPGVAVVYKGTNDTITKSDTADFTPGNYEQTVIYLAKANTSKVKNEILELENDSDCFENGLIIKDQPTTHGEVTFSVTEFSNLELKCPQF
jgi:hypothetical protein